MQKVVGHDYYMYMKVDGQYSLLGDHEHLEEQGGIRTLLVSCCYLNLRQQVQYRID